MCRGGKGRGRVLGEDGARLTEQWREEEHWPHCRAGAGAGAGPSPRPDLGAHLGCVQP